MDNLDRCEAAARARGMTYGVYMINKPKEEPAVKDDEYIPEGWKRCEYCRKVFKPVRSDQRHCSSPCQRAAYSEKNIERIRKRNRDNQRKLREKARKAKENEGVNTSEG